MFIYLYVSQAIFGPTRTTMSKTTSDTITALLAVNAGSVENPFLFFGQSGPATPYGSPAWTRMIKKLFQRNAGRPFAPKGKCSIHPNASHPSPNILTDHMLLTLAADLRASFVTFLRSDHNNKELLKSAATAMRHSSKMAGYSRSP